MSSEQRCIDAMDSGARPYEKDVYMMAKARLAGVPHIWATDTSIYMGMTLVQIADELDVCPYQLLKTIALWYDGLPEENQTP